MSDESVIGIASRTVPYGWPESRRRDVPGYVLENGIALLEDERDADGRYKGGAGMYGMYLQTGRVFEVVRGDDDTITGFREILPQQRSNITTERSNNNMDSDQKMIRFIDSDYKTLFFVPDGGNIVINRYDGEKITAVCTFLDEYHTQIGKEAGRGEVYHICQWAEICERNGNTYAPEKPPALPDKCFSVLPDTGELILIEKGKKSYTPCPWCEMPQARREADRRNSYSSVTRQQEAAMLGGALYGWATTHARTSGYDFKGEKIKPPVKAKSPKSKEQER